MSQSLYQTLAALQDIVTPADARFPANAHGTHVIPEAWDHVATHLRTLAADLAHEPPAAVRAQLLAYLAAVDQATLVWRHELKSLTLDAS